MKLTLGVLLVCLAVANAYLPKALQERLGYLDRPLTSESQRIIGGDSAPANSRPYQVSMELLQLAIFWSHACGGSIVSQNYVLTAAHCCAGSSASSIRIRYGSNTRGSGTIVTVSRVIMHPSWNSQTIDSDFCLLELNGQIVLGANAQIATLVTENPKGGETCTVSGWGATTGGSSSLPTDLKIAEKTCISNAECNQIYTGINAVTASMVCAGHPSKGGCNGDSGGPMTVRQADGTEALAGVVSWGLQNCPTTHPTVYGNVFEVIAWIRQIIGATA